MTTSRSEAPSSWRAWLGFSRLGGPHIKPEEREALEALLTEAAPALKAVSGYPAALLPAFRRATDYVAELAAQVPGPLAISEKDYGLDPLLRHLFADAGVMQQALMLSEATRECVARHCAGGVRLYALLGVRRWIKPRFGICLDGAEGALIRRDVPQEGVSFTDHTLTLPDPEQSGMEALLRHSFMVSLLQCVLDRCHASRDELANLRIERDRLRDALRRAPREQRAALQAQHDALLAEMQTQTGKLAPDAALDAFNAVLNAPEAVLRLERSTLTMNDMGIVCEPREGGKTFDFFDLVGRDRRRWTLFKVHYQLEHPPSWSERLQEAHRWLSV